MNAFSLVYDPFNLYLQPILTILNFFGLISVYPIVQYWILSVRKVPQFVNTLLGYTFREQVGGDRFGIGNFMGEEVQQEYTRASRAYFFRSLFSPIDDILRT
jgi:hypothetical protein